MMKPSNDSAGVHFPPPLVYISIFLISIALQKFFPIQDAFFQTNSSRFIGIMFTGISVIILVTALLQFVLTKNTLITFKPATSLLSRGIFKISRNPIYLGFALLYIGVAFWGGNWWTVILIPAVFAAMTVWVILPEERYLERAFGEDYIAYKSKVRRWLF